jgi:hypothetical protein
MIEILLCNVVRYDKCSDCVSRKAAFQCPRGIMKNCDGWVDGAGAPKTPVSWQGPEHWNRLSMKEVMMVCSKLIRDRGVDATSHQRQTKTQPPKMQQQAQCKNNPLLLTLLGHDDIPQLKPRNKVILLDKPSIDNLPLGVGVVEANLRSSSASCFSKESEREKNIPQTASTWSAPTCKSPTN